jgi:hypothetical protein
MRKPRGWTMEEQEARSMLELIQERITAGNIEVAHRDGLIRLAAMIEDDLAAQDQTNEPSPTSAFSKVIDAA